MVIIYVIYLVLFVVAIVAACVCLKIKASGMNVKDFLEFIVAINDLDTLYIYSKSKIHMNDSEQKAFLKEAEKMFSKFEKVPSMIWEDEYEKYSQVLETYKNIRMLRWSETTA
ncbi:MAG: hypothetical protein IJH12_07325 [Clostridia bacterium]|nr:hypothetical protein [Clostridia bacterium]